MVSVVETAMHVFIHTDRATRPPPLGSGFVLHTGVSSEPKFHQSSLSDPSASHSNIYATEKNSWMRQQARKFEWALQTARAHRAPEPWLLADTDVIIQCGAEALRYRVDYSTGCVEALRLEQSRARESPRPKQYVLWSRVVAVGRRVRCRRRAARRRGPRLYTTP